jgi:hypothetical protein
MTALPAVRGGTQVGRALLGLGVVGGYLVAFGLTAARTSYDVWGALVVGPVLVAVSVPLLARAARAETDPRRVRLLCWALALKLLAAIARFAVGFGIYGGVADAAGYSSHGAAIAAAFRHGVFSLDLGSTGTSFVGTGFVNLATGIVYTVTGATILGGFLVFSWLAFWGLYLLYRAFVLAVPDGDHRRYALLVLLLPSLLFWPASIGKEALMMLGIGTAAYGLARVLVHRRGGFGILGLGLALTAMIRPHITLLIVAATIVGYLLRHRGPRSTVLHPLTKAVGLLALVAALGVVVTRTLNFLGPDVTGQGGSVTAAIQTTESRTSEGGSEFDAHPVSSPVDLPRAFVTVAVRPFPFEAGNPLTLAASVEGCFLLALLAVSWRRLASIPRRLLHDPYLAAAMTFTLLFVIAFSGFSNFGILTRERVQMLPFLLVAVALPAARRGRRARGLGAGNAEGVPS